MDTDALRAYLDDHLSGAVAAVELIEHGLEHNPDGPLGDTLRWLRAEVGEDKKVLESLRERFGSPGNPVKEAVAWAAEKVGRLKGSDGFGAYTPLRRLEEIESIALGILGKRALWASLQAVQPLSPPLADLDFEALIERAGEQFEAVEPHRLSAARAALVGGDRG